MAETGAARRQPDQTAKPDRVFADILCAVDGTRRSYAAVEQAAVLAGPTGHLTLLAVTAVAGGSGTQRRAAISPSRAEGIVEHARRMAKDAGVPAKVVIDPAGPPPQVILQQAVEHDMLALGAPASSCLGAKFIDGVAEAALGSFTTPLLVARSTPTGEHRFPQRILVASDGTNDSDALVELAGRLARAHGASVVLLHAAGVESRARPHRTQEQARRLAAALDGASEVRVEPGSAAEMIVHAAKDAEASLVVVGSRRLGGLKGLGSVSRRVVHDARCSVLLIPPEYLQG